MKITLKTNKFELFSVGKVKVAKCSILLFLLTLKCQLPHIRLVTFRAIFHPFYLYLLLKGKIKQTNLVLSGFIALYIKLVKYFLTKFKTLSLFS